MRLKFAFLLAATLMAISQPAESRAYQISGPQLGDVADSANSTLRIVNGIPGASTLGGAIGVDVKIRKSEVSLKHNYALTINDSGDLVLIANLSEAPFQMSVAGAASNIDVIAISPNESVAAVYSLTGSRLQIIGGLPADAAVHFEVETASIGATLTAMAVNDHGQILAAFSNDETGAVYDHAGRWSSVVVDGELRHQYRFRSNRQSCGSCRSWSEPGSASGKHLHYGRLNPACRQCRWHFSPVGIAFAEGATAIVANGGSGTVSFIPTHGGGPRELSCQCRLTTLRSLRGSSLFALTEATDEPIAVLDADPAGPQVFIVPATH